MAEETVNSATSSAVPPKANPLSAPATVHAPIVGATQKGLKPGLKLPTKPGLAAGLKLPPRPGATVTGLKPGVRLPTRPMIRKPGTPVAPSAVNSATAAPAAPTAAPAPAAPMPQQPKPMDALKAVTQNLKSITSPMPQQAILRKTGLIADSGMTEAQKQAAKSKTARISLSDAMGVAPVKNDAAPMKTIRIKRPTDIPGATSAPAAAAAPAPVAPAAAPTPSTPAATKPAAAAPATAPATTTSFTQRKTLKISRPTGGAVRPTGKFGVKATAPAAAPAGDVADIPDIADIPDMPAAGPVPPMPRGDLVPDVSKGVATASMLVQVAACLAMGFLGWLLWENTQLPLYCGGCL